MAVPAPTFNYQTRLLLAPEAAAALDAYAKLEGQVERKLFAAMQAGDTRNDLKRRFIADFGITARQFNSVRVMLEGKIAGVAASLAHRIEHAKSRVERAERIVARTRSWPSSPKRDHMLHHKQRRLVTLKSALARLEADAANGAVRLCFGGRKLFRAQFALAKNGYASHAEWKRDWERARESQFVLVGSSSETAGNNNCQGRVAEDGSITLRLRLPPAIAAGQDWLELPGLRFAYGHEQVTDAIRASQYGTRFNRAGEEVRRRVGVAITYRFARDEKGWRVITGFEAQPVANVSYRAFGAIGIDINADHLALAEIKGDGNLRVVSRVPLNLRGKTATQRTALVNNAAARIAIHASTSSIPVVIEQLDFARKRAELEAVDAKQARMLTSFTHAKLARSLRAACYRHGVEVVEVNSAYTSVIGAVSAGIRGISIHQGAALAVARRGLGFSERPPTRTVSIPSCRGDHFAFDLPVRNRSKHAWSHWAKARKALRAAHTAHLRSPPPSGGGAPSSPVTRTLSASRTSTAQLRGANRSQHRLGNVVGQLPRQQGAAMENDYMTMTVAQGAMK